MSDWTADGGGYKKNRVNSTLIFSLLVCHLNAHVSLGRLAPTRGLGDVSFKNNKTLPSEEQITADPANISHKITDKDGFPVEFGIACPLQQVINILESDPKSQTLIEVDELICLHCLTNDAPVSLQAVDHHHRSFSWAHDRRMDAVPRKSRS